MRYQLVLQFRGDSLADYDQMIALEDRLIEALGDSADIDGHDTGSGETNIFIFTSDPVATFRQTQPVLQSMDQLKGVTAAFRDVQGVPFTLLWPEGSRGVHSCMRHERPTRQSSEWLARHAKCEFGSCWRASHRSPSRSAAP